MALRNIKSVYDVREELTILENHGCATTVREDERFSHTIRGFSFIDNPNMSDNDAIRKERIFDFLLSECEHVNIGFGVRYTFNETFSADSIVWLFDGMEEHFKTYLEEEARTKKEAETMEEERRAALDIPVKTVNKMYALIVSYTDHYGYNTGDEIFGIFADKQAAENKGAGMEAKKLVSTYKVKEVDIMEAAE